MPNYKDFLVRCSGCGYNTSKKYARENGGLCKPCFTGIEREYNGPKCPDCGGPISQWKLSKGYHCDSCTRNADPIGAYNESMGYYD